MRTNHMFTLVLAGHLATDTDPYVKGVGCKGDETHLSECDLYSSHQCSGGAAVSCQESDEGQTC